MNLQEWIRLFYKTETLRFDHLWTYLNTTPQELEEYINRLNPWLNIALKSSDGIDDAEIIDELEHYLLRRFKKRKKKAKVTLEVELELPEDAFNFSQTEKMRMIERVTNHMEAQNLKDWRIVRMQRI
ncbi:MULTISPECIES: hypothetical protein [unclassified Exiguobacterium]|uniref:hypothetical protein n=1 Tax=unclassified Exiguobacterium TaxID=2644629 RepID=UPI001040D955|nr:MULTISPECIES: hypothetical protein [unclassified Exiguobacterium]TCI42955.1 hypothetical protein EVJ31_13195 [Exiguobacterium sp. SH5S32]TCI49709.1 hypothetical protein EVJ25_13805 [Exiguobacterium sp. SH1S4]TCI67772.1 hypothetical protein EVJ23_13215 [Exiguobacterium sp. SH1S1]